MPNRIPAYRPPGSPRNDRERHQQFKRDRTDKERQAFYVSRAWRQLRLLVLAIHPICQHCHTAPSAIADHVIDVRDAPDLALSESNIKALCKSCHNAKTARTVNTRRGQGCK